MTDEIRFDHSAPNDLCGACGDAFVEETTKAEVINTETDERLVVHQSCYLDHDDIYELA